MDAMSVPERKRPASRHQGDVGSWLSLEENVNVYLQKEGLFARWGREKVSILLL